MNSFVAGQSQFYKKLPRQPHLLPLASTSLEDSPPLEKLEPPSTAGSIRNMRTHTAAILGLLALSAAPAWAVLGDSMQSVQRDTEIMQGALVTMTRKGYSIQQISARSGHVIKEYVTPDGTVFGVSWQGPTIPNLQRLLGSYFTHFQAAQQSSRRHGPLVVRNDEVVIESGGHMRAFQGRAYVPRLLPEGVPQAAIR